MSLRVKRRKFTKSDRMKVERLCSKGVSDIDIINQTNLPKHYVTRISSEYWSKKLVGYD